MMTVNSHFLWNLVACALFKHCDKNKRNLYIIFSKCW